MQWEPIQYPSYSASQASLMNFWVAQGLDNTTFTLGSFEFQARLLANGEQPSPPALRVDFMLSECRFACYLSEDAVNQLLQGTIDASKLAGLDEVWRMALLEAALAEMVESVRQDVRLSLTLSGAQGSMAAPPAHGIRMAVTPAGNAGASWNVTLVLDDQHPQEVADYLARFGQPATLDYSWLPLPVAMELGHTALSLQEVQALKAGDIVMCDVCHFDEERLNVNIANSLYAPGHREGSQVVLEGPVALAAPPPADTGELVTFRFVFSRTSLPLGSVYSLGTGSAISAPSLDPGSVEVMVGDRLLAQGETVDVGGRIGVRLRAARSLATVD